MATISELLVRIKPEGIKETNQQLERHGDQFEKTAGDVGDSTDELESFSQRWSGAMTAIVAGLAIATAGLLTQVPVVGELFGGLSAIVDALAFQVDKALRPALSGLTSELFDISSAMFAADGPIEALDILADKIADVSAQSIDIAVEEDVVATAVDNLVKIVFPEVGKADLLSAIFSFDLSGAAVVTALIGGATITAAKVLTILLPTTITATSLLAFVFPVIATAAVLSHVFDINMTKTAILGAIFSGVLITAAAIVGAISWPVIAGAAIVGTLFAGVTITADMIIRELFGIPKRTPEEEADVLSGTTRSGTQPPRLPPRLRTSPSYLPEDNESAFQNIQPGWTPGGSSDLQVVLDGRQQTEDTGRYRLDAVARRRGI